MKNVIAKFSVVPSYRKLCIGVAAGVSTLAASSAFADIADGAVASITGAQTQGETVGTAVVGVVAALCVVGVVIALVRKV